MYYRFEKLEVWRDARTFTNEIYKQTRNFPSEEKFGLTSQIRRASQSIMLNIAEGSERKSDADYIRFLRIASGSLQEVISAWYIALDQEYIDRNAFNMIYIDSHKISKKLNALISYLKK